MKKYAIGLDFGTLSARAVLIDDEGSQLAESVKEYPHGVLDKALPSGRSLGVDWALQVPADYQECLIDTVSEVVKGSGVKPEEVVGLGVDFTSCSVMPVLADGTPLCELKEFRDEPHAYVKLWKHHAAQYCADILNEKAESMKEPWLPYYGGKISSEWALPKIMQIVKEAPEVYEKMDRFIECGDWVIWKLCGKERRSVCNAGYKLQWRAEEGYPSKAFMKALDERLENFAEEKLSSDLYPVGSLAGYLTPEMAARCGLTEKTAVAVEIVDAHASVPACGIDGAGKMLMAMGTSTCHLLLGDEEKPVPGIGGVVKDGILPGFYAYEAGQSCVGDHFSWFIENCLPASYEKEAKEKGLNLHQLLRQKAGKLIPGESGLLALDWWNGVRSPYMDFDLSGVMLGMTLQTRPEEIYRSLIEATAYGTRRVIESFTDRGVAVNELYAGGGIARKDPMTMQIYADVCNREIHIADSSQSGALGSAVLGFYAGGLSGDMGEIVRRIGRAGGKVYRPIPENAKAYEKLYREYEELSEYFGNGGNDVMHRLKAGKLAAKGKRS